MAKKPASRYSTNIFFEHNEFLPMLYGQDDQHLARLEKMLNVEAIPRGNMVSVSGNERDCAPRLMARNHDQYVIDRETV